MKSLNITFRVEFTQTEKLLRENNVEYNFCTIYINTLISRNFCEKVRDSADFGSKIALSHEKFREIILHKNKFINLI